MRRAAPLILAAVTALVGGRGFAQTPPPAPSASAEPTRGDALRAYHAALASRRLGQADFRLEDVRDRVAEGEALLAGGRHDEAIARLVEMVEHPRFELFAETEEGRAAVFRLGDALATAGVAEPARAYLRRVLKTRGAWDGNATWARRAVRRLVDVALDSQGFEAGAADVKDVPASAPEETRGEVSYLEGRAREASGEIDAAVKAYTQVTQRSRFWAQATYLRGLLHVEQGKYKEAEDLFCKVADPKRQSRTTPVFADEHYFAVRDLARLGLGRVAHEQGRHDDARYYYYLVPRDSERLAEALYEAATTRYEKKDYDGARELLDELKALSVHHPYEDEVQVLDAYVDLARCKFDDADKKLVAFVKRWEPVREAARRVAGDDRALAQLLSAARTGADAGGGELAGGAMNPDAMRSIAALVRLDAGYGVVVKRRAVLEREASGLRGAQGQLGDIQQALATNGGVRPAEERKISDAERQREVREVLAAVRRQIDELAAQGAEAKVAALRDEAKALEARLTQAASPSGAAPAPGAAGKDLPDLLAADVALAASLGTRIDEARRDLGTTESQLARDALHRVDLRLSRLLRRARLGRIESVLGRKRALEVEIEAIGAGILPQAAFDSLDAERYLLDKEEYWPFEGDDWPDEFVGGEQVK